MAQPCLWLLFSAQTNPIQLEEQRVWCHLWTLLYSHRFMSAQASSSFHKLWVQSGCLAPHVQITSSEDKSTSDNRGGEFIMFSPSNQMWTQNKGFRKLKPDKFLHAPKLKGLQQRPHLFMWNTSRCCAISHFTAKVCPIGTADGVVKVARITTSVINISYRSNPNTYIICGNVYLDANGITNIKVNKKNSFHIAASLWIKYIWKSITEM